MIRFVCKHCDKPVRVPDAFGGKKGRCPFCKELVAIPPAGPAETPPPAPPHTVEDLPPEREPDLDLTEASDPRSKTDALTALGSSEVLTLADEGIVEPSEREPSPWEQAKVAQQAIAEAAAATKKRRALIGGGVLLAAVLAAGVTLLLWRPWETGGPAPTATSVSEQATVKPEPPKPPAAILPKPAEVYPLSSGILAATGRTPAGALLVAHVDFLEATEALTSGPPAGGVQGRIAASALWADARQRMEQGALPTSATLYVAGRESYPMGRMFGPFYGLRPGQAKADPAGGLWGLAGPEATAPHFLVRLTGPAAEKLSGSLLARAKAMKLPGELVANKPAVHGMLRLAPAGMARMDAKGEMLVGSAGAIESTGKVTTDSRQRERINRTLSKIPTRGRAIVGWARLRDLRQRVNSSLGVALAVPAWEGSKTVLVFAIDPAPAGKADLMFVQPAPDSLTQVQAAAGAMSASLIGQDIRLTGSGPQGLTALAELLPGFRQLALKALAQVEAKPAPPDRVGSTDERTGPPEPTVTKPKPKPEQPRTKPAKAVPFICYNTRCRTKGKVFQVPADKVPEAVHAGVEPLTCPQCKRPTAVKAVKCAACGKFHAQTFDVCPHCDKSGV